MSELDHQEASKPQASEVRAATGSNLPALLPTPRPQPRRLLAVLQAWRIRAPVLLAAALAALYFAVPFVLGPIITVDPVLHAEFIQTVVATGHVEAPNRINIGSQIVGIVADVPVAEGQTVRAGDTLIRLDDHEASGAVVQAEGALAQAEARVRQIRELALPSTEQALIQAQANLRNAQQTYERAAILARDAYGTRAALDDATKTLNVAQAALRAAEFQVATNRPGGSDATMADTQLNQAHAALATARSRLGYTVIKAPVDGVLIARVVERGNVVQPANVLMKLSPAGDTQLVVEIDEKNIGLVHLGQHALVSADAFPSQHFAAEIVYINPGVDLQRAIVEVKLRAPKPPPQIIQDMTVSVDIEVARIPDALVLPARDVHDPASAAPWVLRADGGRARRTPVKVGLVDIGKVQILEGLQAQDLAIPAAAMVSDGARLRARVLP